MPSTYDAGFGDEQALCNYFSMSDANVRLLESRLGAVDGMRSLRPWSRAPISSTRRR